MKATFAAIKMPDEGVIVLPVGEDRTLGAQAQAVDRQTDGALSRAMAGAPFTGKHGQTLTVIAPAGREKATYVLVGAGPGKDFDTQKIEEFGAAAYKAVQRLKARQAVVLTVAPKGTKTSAAEVAAHIANGAALRSYRYDKYRTRERENNNNENGAKVAVERMSFLVSQPAAARQAFRPLTALATGVDFARDLVSEPSNVKSPKWMATQCRKLTKLGVKVEVLGEAQMRKLGMNALLAVGQGSARESQCVVMRWDGGKKGDKPVALIGKGVTFDTGGISIKPSGGMEDMIWDMGGAGAVIGAMHALAGRKAKANVIGLVGLVENMPDGNAQRPGDIVTTMSGQTVEVINTDAEGRLVLADVLWYAQKRFKPDVMIDLATLTGAIMVGLGREYAGLYASTDELAAKIRDAGKTAGEKLWHMPLDKAYDRQINTPRADMKNVGPRWGGSITAAQFLQRFTNDVPWAHLDIAGVAWAESDKPTMEKGATAFGVRTLDRFVQDNYEG